MSINEWLVGSNCRKLRLQMSEIRCGRQFLVSASANETTEQRPSKHPRESTNAVAIGVFAKPIQFVCGATPTVELRNRGFSWNGRLHNCRTRNSEPKATTAMATNRAFTHRCCAEKQIPPNRFSHAPPRSIILLTMFAPEKLTVALMNDFSTLGSRVTCRHKMFL